MARDKITEYSATASENTVCGDVNIAENSALPSDMNNFAREIMSHLKDLSAGTSGVDVLSFDDDDASASIKLQAPSAVTSSTTFTLPDGDGSSGQFIKTDGSGNLSFGSVTNSGAYDLNGGALTLDADGDTKIVADTDDVISFDIGGVADRFKVDGTRALHTNGIFGRDTTDLIQFDGSLCKIFLDGNQRMQITNTGQLKLDSEGGTNLLVDVRQGSIKQWSQNNGNGAVQDSYNTSSVSDTSNGVFQININNDMNSDNYVLTIQASGANNNHPPSQFRGMNGGGNTLVGSYRVEYRNADGNEADPAAAMNGCFGDLA